MPITSIQWSSRLAFIMAAAGNAAGLGNIWLFPYMAGVSGGGAFVIIYLAAVVVLALPLLIAELMIGRRGAAGPPQAIANVASESGHSTSWGWMGIVLGGAGALMMLGFYVVVGGWTMAYTFKLAAGQLQQIDAATATGVFNDINSSAGSLLPWVIVFLAATVYISARGVVEGIEKAVRVMMPALVVMLIIMVIYGAAFGEFGRAVSFLFNPDFSKVDGSVVLTAFGLAFFSVSVGLTGMMAYGSYISREINLPRTAAVVMTADTGVALLAGLAIFPIVFMYGLEPAGGEGLVFETLPIAFAQVPGGQFFGTMFFILLFFAALSSSIGMLEPSVSWLRDASNLSRRAAALLAGSIVLVLGMLAALSFNVLAGVHPLGMFAMFESKGFFELFIYTVTQFLIPLGGIMIAVFAGWIVKTQFSRDELFKGSETLVYKGWLFVVRFLAPVLLGFVLVDVATG